MATADKLDYLLETKNQIKEAKIYPEIMGSDHCPVGLELK